MEEGKSTYVLEDIHKHKDTQTGRILFKENSSFIICGRSGSGKTTFIYDLLRNINLMFENKNNRQIHILYCYAASQPLFRDMKDNIKNFTLHKGLPDEDLIDKLTSPSKIHLIPVSYTHLTLPTTERV